MRVYSHRQAWVLRPGPKAEIIRKRGRGTKPRQRPWRQPFASRVGSHATEPLG